ncbi:oligo-1,6-glucosidase [Lachnoanaerobaculum sp. JCM 36186]|uniref:glycoside hydrolase family 13 protein n=1 Tax=Lachnoanaerobaculum sanguinis TaxID=3065809 RepID=UPI0027683117|nr:alpha-glucosidase [Lachnoanaerobaculum sp. JCM 36186]GMO02880.1 oligo-1,6-glucosidase [Lachnoanaerobaculum sp. JCM 36186]
MKKAWWKEAVVYQIYPRSFCDSNGDGIGDLNGITSKLDYLKELGIDVIWLSPVYKSPNDDNGYDISDYEDIMTEFGTMDDFDKMLAAAHERGIRIVMDLVVNHTSDEHPWFVESRSSKDNEKRDYYIWKEGKDGKEPTNWGSAFSGPAWKYDEKTDMYYLHLFSVKQPDLNWENPKVRKEVFDMMTRWCEKGIDGFRMDVISLISKPEGYPDAKVVGLYGDMGICANGPKVHDYLKEMNEKVLSKFDIMTVGETAGVTLEEAKKYANTDGSELNMVFQFEHMDLDGGEKFKWSTKPMPLVPLKENLSKWQKGLDGVAWNSLYFCNHDQPRIVSRLGDESDAYRELSAKCIATCLHMMQGTPYVYQGEELGMTNTVFNSVDDFRDLESINAYRELVESGLYTDEDMFPKIAHKSRDNARTPMQWDASENAGFTKGTPWIAVNPNYKKINVADQLKREDSVFHYYQKLIRLRKENEIIVYGNYELLLPEDENIFAYTRTLDNQKLLVVCNFSKSEQKFDFSGYENAKVLISNYNRDAREDGILKPYEATVLLLENA